MYGGDYQRGVQNERLANQLQNLRRDRYVRGLEARLAQCESYRGQWQRFAEELREKLAQAEWIIDQQRQQLAEAAEHSSQKVRSLESQLEWTHEDCSWMASVVNDYRYGLAPFGYLQLPAHHQPRQHPHDQIDQDTN